MSRDETRYHVITRFMAPGWIVRRTGAQRAHRRCSSAKDGVGIALAVGAAEIYVHRRDGTVERKIQIRAI